MSSRNGLNRDQLLNYFGSIAGDAIYRQRGRFGRRALMSVAWVLLVVIVVVGTTAAGHLLMHEDLSSTELAMSIVVAFIVAIPAVAAYQWMSGRARANYQQLKAAQADLLRSEKLAALGSLVAGIAHQLNTPVGNCVTVTSAMQGRTQMLADSLSTGLRRSALDAYIADAHFGIDILMRNLQQLAEIVESFKEIAADQNQKRRDCFDMDRAIQKSLQRLDPQLDVERYAVTVEVQQNLEMDSYQEALEQVLVQLLDNARFHGFQGREKGEITVRARQKNHRTVRISVRDNGCGIPVHHLQRIFEPFFTTRLGQGGSGLGLAVARNIVEHVLGGSIRVLSRMGEGTKFIIELPITAPEILASPQFVLSGHYTGMHRQFHSTL